MWVECLAPVLALLFVAAPVRAERARALEDFARAEPLRDWKLHQVRGEVEEGHLHVHFPRWKPGEDRWPAAILDLGQGLFHEADWRPWEVLGFSVANRGALPALLRLRLDDGAGARAYRSFSIPAAGQRLCQVELASLSGELDLGRIVHFNLFMEEPQADYSFAVGPIGLQAGELALEAVRLYADPFQGGSIGLEARFNRFARGRVEVVDGEGVSAVAEELEGARWGWELGEAVRPGSYQVALHLVDAFGEAGERQIQVGGFEVLPEASRPALVAWVEPSTRKVMLDQRPRAGQHVYAGVGTGEGPPIEVDMARNEREAVQVVFADRRGGRFRFAVEALSVEAEIYQVGYVFTRDPLLYAVEREGWWPDPLLPVETMRARPGERLTAWISLEADARVPAGVHRGGLAVWRDGERLGALPLEVRVREVALPDSTSVRTAFSLFEHMLEKVYGEVGPALRGRYRDFVAGHRLNVGNLYRGEPPPVAELARLAGAGRLNAVNLLYIETGAYDAARLAGLAARLDPVVEQLRRLGLAERAYIYGFDEAGPAHFSELHRVFAFLKERYPEVRTATTARDPDLGARSGLHEVVDIWVPLTAAWDPASAAAARARGDEVWWYICIAPTHPHANWFVEYPALEARLLWWMSFQQGVEGFLYYALNQWPNQDQVLRLDGEARTAWNPASFETANGDGYLLYAGPEGPIGSVRLENVRDGIEDFELLGLLGREEGLRLCAELIESTTDFARDEEHFARVRSALLDYLERSGK